MVTLLENNFLNIHAKKISYRTNIIGFSLGISEGNVVGVILVKGMGCTHVETDILLLG